ncbi:MAG: ATP-dependent DNA helicase [Proteobacteria bacterium]|nr:ATP-dependent DNA helicase [Pseudomonadota bacterium]
MSAQATGSEASELDGALRRLGLAQFRPGQREAIELLLERRKLLLVAPTGGGKSLVYQLPATMLSGVSLVVSPLVALMHDQVQSLRSRGVSCTYFAATLEPAEIGRRMAQVARGGFDLIYVAPERLALPGFRALLARMDVALIAVDEAHCISEWGHDFRPDYLQLGQLIASKAGARVLACTATATPVVRDEIVARLGLGPDTPQLVRGFARPNLALHALEIEGPRERPGHVDAMLRRALGTRPGEHKEPPRGQGAAIVYAPTRKLAEAEAVRLQGAGYRCACYHAGLAAAERESCSLGFAQGKLDVVVATNAFGMGIDRPDVRAVIHLAPPGSVEAYYQEVGRAGRDGQRAYGLVLMSGQDLPLRRRLLELAPDGHAPEPNVVEHKWNLFLELVRWIEGGSCRHDAILRYFDDTSEQLAGCGLCDECQRMTGESEQDSEEVSLIVRKVLSGVGRIHHRFGMGLLIRLLRGQLDPRLTSAGLQQVRTFGVLSEHGERWLTRVVRRCVTAGWVGYSNHPRPTLYLTAEGREVMRGSRPARVLLPPAESVRARGPGKRVQRQLGGQPLDSVGQQVFEALRLERLKLARAQAVPPYVIASDRTLRDIAQLRPRTADELRLAHGIGQNRADRYGARFLEAVRSVQS